MIHTMTTIPQETHNGTITNWIPLTTPGPPSPSMEVCSSALYFLPGVSSEIVAFDPYYGRWIETTIRCLATEQSLWWDQHSDGVTSDINLGPFSCPTGYTTATASSIDPTSTYVGCCPSSYDFQGMLLPAATLGQCQSSLTVGQTIVAMSTSNGFNWISTTAVIPSQPASIIGVHINGFIFNNVAATSPASVSAITTRLSASQISSLTPSNTAIKSSSLPSGQNASHGSHESGLSNGAKAGIGVGASLVVLGIVGAVATLLLLKRRRINGRAAAWSTSEPHEGPYEAPGDMNHPPYSRFMSAKPQQAPYTYAEANGSPAKPNTGPAEMWVSPSQGG